MLAVVFTSHDVMKMISQKEFFCAGVGRTVLGKILVGYTMLLEMSERN